MVVSDLCQQLIDTNQNCIYTNTLLFQFKKIYWEITSGLAALISFGSTLVKLQLSHPFRRRRRLFHGPA
jgi:hypothetical protein